MSDRLFDYEFWGNDVYPVQTNQALEEYLLRRIGNIGGRTAALRFSSFSEDGIIIGYAEAPDIINPDSDVSYARRISGGAHVYVGPNVLTYTFAAPRDGTFGYYEEMRAYYADAIASSLRKLGINDVSVDNKASVITVRGRIIAGHAMSVGLRSAVLHGQLMIAPYDVDKIASSIVLKHRIIDGEIYTEYDALKALPSVATELNGRSQDVPSLRKVIGDIILHEVTGGDYEQIKIDDRVLAEAGELLRARYGRRSWLETHNPAFTKEELEEIPGEELDGPLKENLGYCFFLQVADKDFKNMV